MTRYRLCVLLVCAAATLAGALTSAPTALAGSYVVSTCSPTNSSGAWTQVNTAPDGFSTGNLCGGPAIGPLDGSTQGALHAEDILNSPAQIPNGAQAGWLFNAPPGTTITAISYYRSLEAFNDPDMVAGLFQASGAPLEQCKIPFPFLPGDFIDCSMPNNQVPSTFTGLNTTSLFLGVVCRIVDPHPTCIDGGTIHAARASMYSARVTLSQAAPPMLGAPGGPLWAGGTLAGVVPVTFAASDPSGIASETVRSDSGLTLATVAQACDFTSTQPCPQQPAATISVDTTQVPNGSHTFSLLVTDAAGNTTTTLSPSAIVNNPTPQPPPGPGPTPPGPTPTPGTATKIKVVLRGARLSVSGTVAVTGRLRVSWRSKRHGHSIASGARTVTTHAHKLSVTFTLPRRARARAGTTIRVAVRSGTRLLRTALAQQRS